MGQIAEERHKQIFEMRSSGKSLREIGKLLGISGTRVQQIVELHQHRLIEEQNLRSSNDPVFQALSDGKIPKMLFNSLVRGGYGNSFGFEQLITQLKNNTLDPMEFRNFGKKSLRRLREIFLTQEEINELAHKK
jgi:hypothetical protein